MDTDLYNILAPLLSFAMLCLCARLLYKALGRHYSSHLLGYAAPIQ